MKSIFYQNTWHLDDERLFTADNRSLKYGDGFFESMRAVNGRINFLDLHIKRIQTTSRLLGFNLEESGFSKAVLLNSTAHFLQTNRQKHVRIRIQFFRYGGKQYAPANAKTAFYIQFASDDSGEFSANQVGKTLYIFQDYALANDNPLSNIKTSNSLIYVLAKKQLQHIDTDEILLLNSKGQIAEFSSSNILLDFGDRLITPPLSSGCLDGIVRSYLLQQKNPNFNVEEQEIELKDLESAQAIYGTNTSVGAFYIKQFNNITYTSGRLSQLIELLNQ